MPASHKVHTLPALLLAVTIAIPSASLGEPAAEAEVISQKIAEGIQALESDDYDGAVHAFREALAAAPNSEPALLGLSEALALQGDSVAALAVARQALDAAPRSATATLAVARQLARLGESAQALQELRRLRALDPEELQGYRLSALLLRDLGRGDEAIALLELALEQDLRDPRLEEELALLLIAADRPQEARHRAEEALAVHGETAGLQLAYGLATVATDSADRAQAVSLLERALELGVQEPAKVHLELGSLLLESNRPLEAIEHLRLAEELSPNSPEVYYKLGAAQRMTGDATGARQSLARFQELKAEKEQEERLELDVGTALNEAQELATANRLPEALERLDKLLHDHPGEARAHTLRAKILYSLRRQREALAAIERSRLLDPTRIEPNYLEGMFLLELNRPAEARAALMRAVSLDPELGEAYVLLGGAAAKLNQPTEAVTHFERALELGTDSPSLRLGLADALASLGRLAESAEQEEAYRRLVQRPR